jgi:hypothetical protein
MQDTHTIQTSSNKPVWYFLLFWTVFNGIQAYTLEVHGDEAYYWMYSRFLDWGYFDHPPMVAVFIKIGDSLIHNELGLRLLTVLTNSCSIYLIWLILKRYVVDARWFIVVVSSLFIFHIYGFTTTPDSPLLFFTALFYYVYQCYLERDTWLIAFLMAVITACLLYSKYHGVLLIGFTVCANLKLLTRKSFWFIAVLAAVLFVPHIIWQVENEFPSLKYHLVDRSAGKYDPQFTYLYPIGQLAMAGPFVGWFLFYAAFKVKISDVFIRGLMVNCIGTFIFFMLSTLKGEVQMHWTLIAFVPMLMLVLISFRQSLNPPKWFFALSIVNITFIVFIRIALIFQFPFVMKVGQLESYFGFRTWEKQVHNIVGDNYLLIRDGFQDPSKYNYYSKSTHAMSYDSRFYRHTQYDSWPIEDSMQHRRAYFMQDTWEPGFTTDSVVALYGRKWYTAWVNDVRTYQQVVIEVPQTKLVVSPGKVITFNLSIKNPCHHPINFSNAGWKHVVVLEACFLQNGNMRTIRYKPDGGFNNISLKAGESYRYRLTVRAPEQKGLYDMLFSIRTAPFPGSRNSPLLSVEVK